MTTREEQKVEEARRRYLRLFKSISCAGDLLRLSVCEQTGEKLWGIFVTLTYRPEVDWEPGQIASYMQRLRMWFRRQYDLPLRCVWVAEQHKSGRVHYHVIVFVPQSWRPSGRRKGRGIPKPDSSYRMEGRECPPMWPCGGSEVAWCRKPSVGYLVKYATKCRDVRRPWPKGCRLHGHAGLTPCQRERRSWYVLPRYMREQCDQTMRVRRRVGGGWISPVTGEIWPAFGQEGFSDSADGPSVRLPWGWWIYWRADFAAKRDRELCERKGPVEAGR